MDPISRYAGPGQDARETNVGRTPRGEGSEGLPRRLAEQVLHDGGFGAGADPAADLLASLEEDEGGHREDAERRGRVLGLVDVALHHLDLALHLAGDLVDDGGEDLAG